MTLSDFHRIIAYTKQNTVGTIFVNGERYYVWGTSQGETGWLNPGPYKAAVRGKIKIKRKRPSPLR